VGVIIIREMVGTSPRSWSDAARSSISEYLAHVGCRKVAGNCRCSLATRGRTSNRKGPTTKESTSGSYGGGTLDVRSLTPGDGGGLSVLTSWSWTQNP